MKKTFTITIFLLSASILFGQNKIRTQPFIIKGQITNCPEKYLQIYFQDKNDQVLIDTINLDGSGKFYLKTFKVKQPQQTEILQNHTVIKNIFVAPGYNLTITGSGKDFLSLLKTKKITGIGSESNRYQFILDSILVARMDMINWTQLNETALLTYIQKDQQLKDSIAHAVFDRKATQDKFFKYFASVVQFNNTFTKLYFLVALVNRSNYNYEQSVAFVRNNFDNNILDNLFRDEYLISKEYKNGLIGGEYLRYLIGLDLKKDSTLHQDLGYKLEKINKVYGGKVKELVLYNLMKSSIGKCNSFKNIDEYENQFETYISNLKNQYYKKSLASEFAEKETELLRTQVGKPAPRFTLESNTGSTYSLDGFKGKVVYLDLWASWCHPCRAQTPSFKTLYNKYKNDNRIAFVSIAVSDSIAEWKKALEDDKPTWLQLIDKDGIVYKSYVAHPIPKFILIDKHGNIVNFDAPRPSSGNEIEKLLNQEIIK